MENTLDKSLNYTEAIDSGDITLVKIYSYLMDWNVADKNRTLQNMFAVKSIRQLNKKQMKEFFNFTINNARL